MVSGKFFTCADISGRQEAISIKNFEAFLEFGPLEVTFAEWLQDRPGIYGASTWTAIKIISVAEAVLHAEMK